MNDAAVGEGDWAIVRHGTHLSKPSKLYHGLILRQRRRPCRRLQHPERRFENCELARRIVRAVEGVAVGAGHEERPRRADGFAHLAQQEEDDGGDPLALELGGDQAAMAGILPGDLT